MDRHSGGGLPPHLRGRPVSGSEAAHANEYFEHFLNATTLKNILGYHRSMSELLHLKPNVFPQFYPKLRANLTSWKAKALWKKFDARISHKCYGKGKACAGTRVLVIGAGPCGLRTAIEAQLLGAKVVVVEKRDRLSRNNVLHLWPFVIEDLRMLGAKKFFGKFCAGAIDHISIRQLQCILLKVALLLGVEIHTEVSFEGLIEPSATDKVGWRAEIKPENHPMGQYEFDAIIGADGKRNTLQGFKRKEFRGKLAIAITANFINKKTEAEASVEEISGVAFIFNQKFFKDLQAETRIDLENIVYYKDDTHYFVMTAKKASLLEKGVIKQDLSDTEKLLAPENVDREALQNYARQAADFSTNYQLPELDFAVNHYGQPDVAMFDFTSMYAAEYASKVVERNGCRLLMILVGDSLLEPFWPTGSGCARGFLSSLDAAWAIRSYCSGQMTPLDVLAERESIYRLLAQTTPDNLNKDWKAYTLDPATRYPNLNKSVVTSHQTVCLYDADNSESIEKMKRASLEAMSRQEHMPKKRRRGNVDNEVLLNWVIEQLRGHEEIAITDLNSVFRNGKALCAIIHHYRPDLLDYSAIKDNEPAKCNQLAMDILEKDLGLPPFMTGEEITKTEDFLAMTTYLTQVYDTFRGEIPHIKHPKLFQKLMKHSSKIPKPSRTQKASFSFAFLEKLQAKYNQFTVVNQELVNSKHKCAGDGVSVGREKKSESLRHLLKKISVKAHTKGLVTGKQRQLISDDLTVISNAKGSKSSVKREHKCHHVYVEAQKSLNEKTSSVTTNLKSLKSLEKRRHIRHRASVDLFDTTYNDERGIYVPKKVENEIIKTSKKLIKSNSVHVHKDKKLKKFKSRNIPLCVNLTLSKTKLKMKESKLSVIAENFDEKCQEKNWFFSTPLKNKEKKNSKKELSEADNNVVNLRDCVSIRKDADVNLERSQVNLYQCETFVDDSLECMTLPKKPTLKVSESPCSSMTASVKLIKEEPNQTLHLVEPTASSPLTSTKHLTASIPNVKTIEPSINTIFGTKSYSPLQIIRKHQLLKKRQLDLVAKEKLSPSFHSRLKNRMHLPSFVKVPGDVTRSKDLEGVNKNNLWSRESHTSSTGSVNIEIIHTSDSNQISCENVEYRSSRNLVKITSKGIVPPRLNIPERVAIKDSKNRLMIFDKSSQTVFNPPNHCMFKKHKSHVRSKKLEQIFENKKKSLKGNVNSCRDNARSILCLKLGKRRLPDLSTFEKGNVRVCETSHFKKSCPETSSNWREQKCSLLHGELSATIRDSCKKLSSSQTCTRVQEWSNQHDFEVEKRKKGPKGRSLIARNLDSDVTSVMNAQVRKRDMCDDVKVEKKTNIMKYEDVFQSLQENMVELARCLKEGKQPHFIEVKTKVKPVSKFSHINMNSVFVPSANFSVIIKGEESELPESNKRGEFLLKSIKISNHQPSLIPSNNQPSRPSSRHKRHNDIMVPKPCSIDRKQRKRRTMERVGPSVEERQKTLAEIASNRQDRQQKRKQQRQRQTDQFLKSMQMLHANCKPDSSEPFEDYSIFLYRQTAPKFQDRVKDLEKQFTYVPDHDSKIPGLKPQANTNAEEDIASKIKSLEDKWSNKQQAEKKPKDLMRAIGKIETSDWNIKQIEKKILENKMGKPSTLNADKERVPRWSREEFKARQTKMERKHLETEDGSDAKYADIDRNIKQLDLKLKEGTNRELGQNKVASITERLASKAPQEKEKPVEKPIQLKPVNLPMQSGSEFCHFCGKRVYLMERLSAEGRFFHHGCFKCQYCHSQLRLGSYMFDRDGQYGYRFFCIHHYGMQGELPRPSKLARKASQKGLREAGRSPQKKVLSGVAGVDLLDRVQTPERIEFSNLSAGNISSDHEEALSQMDEDEWTDKNFGASANELDDSDDSSSSLSDTDSDDEDAFDDALEQPITKEGTMKWAERLKNSYRKGRHSGSDGYSSSDHSSYYENSSDESDSDTATEGEDEIRARELRKQEVRVEPPVVQTDTGTDTEMVSGESSSDSSSEIHNSATEISTDSEFAQDDPTPTRELPSIALGDIFVTKSRGSRKSHYPKRLQVTAGYIEQPRNGRKTEKTNPNIELKLSPLVPSTPTFRKPAPLLARTEGYALNRTQSTGGIAAKVSLELKKKYLLGESGTNSIQKSGSASTLDTKFKSFQNTISDCQKLLKPALEVSPGMQVFCNKLDERHSPVSPQGGFVLSGKTVESKLELPPPDITITTINENKEEGSESRPRSPAHEASIAVPSIDWSKQNDSQSSDSLSLSESASEKAPSFDIPRVEVHSAKESSDKEEMALDSLAPMNTPSGEQTKSITTEKKSLNQPKSLPNLESVLPEIHKALHVKLHKEDSPEDNKTISGKSSPEATTVLTETELSDWAREENASDSIELDLSSEKRKTIKIAQLSEFEEAINHHICGKSSKEMANKTILTEAMNSTLSGNLDHIEYMDTGTETSSEDGVADSQNGYVLFKNEEEDSLNLISESKAKKELALNTGYCEVVKDSFGGEIIDLKPADLERLKQKQALTDHEEDSLIIMETGTTTEENTCSDSTVKNITEIKPSAKLENLQKQRLEEKLAKVKAEQALIKDQKENIENNLQYEEHCQRLQSKVEFGNARDSIDIRKSRRKSKSDSPQKPDLIQEEKERQSPAKEITLNLSPVVRPDVIYKKEDIKKERDVNKKLIEEMVMNKMKAENKSLERKKRNRSNIGNLSPSRPYNLQKSSSSLEKNSPNSSSNYATPDLLSNSVQLSSNDKFSTPMTGYTPKQNSNRPLSVFSTLTDVRKLPATPLTNPENFSMPDIRKNLFGDAPKAPPRYNRPSDVSKTAEKMKETARARARLLSNEDLGLSPEDKINKLREKVGKKPNLHIQESIESLVLNTERRNSLLYSNDTLTKKRNNSFRRAKSGDSDGSLKISENNNLSLRPKSISEIPKNLSVTKSKEMECEKQICKSDPNLLDTSEKPKKKSKDRERRKSITKLIAGIFTKKSPSSAGGKGLFAKLSPKSKAMSKSFTSLDLCKHEAVIEEPKPRKCTSELDVKRREVTPPPIPPLPLNYTLKATDESSDGEMPDGKFQDRSSCDTLDQSMGNTDMPTSGKKSGKSRRLSRQAQLKRHRMAQEIQRKLEETEVKTRELEQRGVEVEKALRGEDGEQGVRDESELLQEWFDLMRDRSELRRYEKELMVRAQELELEDRHSRLQLELRERLDNSEKKTEEDLSIEQSIISEMMDIVAKRDTLIAVLEEDRLRYSHEDKDLEEQMLAKGLMLTPIQKATEK